MSFKSDLEKLLSDKNPTAQLLAEKVKNINDALDAGHITKDEAANLLEDIDVILEISKLAKDLETKILAQKVIDGFKTILGILL